MRMCSVRMCICEDVHMGMCSVRMCMCVTSKQALFCLTAFSPKLQDKPQNGFEVTVCDGREEVMGGRR